MTLDEMSRQLAGMKQTLPLGQTARQGELLCHLAGLTLSQEGTLELLGLEYDPDYLERQEEQSWKDPAPTRRQTLLRQENLPFRRLTEGFPETISLGGLSLKPSQSQSDYGAEGQAPLFCRLLDQGWNPGPLSKTPLDRLMVSRWTLGENWEEIPEIDPQAPVEFTMQKKIERRPVELPLTLEVGRGTEKIPFTDQTTGQTLWMQILQTRLEDMWAQMEQVFAHHRRQGRIPAEQIDRMQAQFERDFARECPRGMLYPAVEYQCEDDSQLDFYLASYLDEPQDFSGHSFGFLTKPEQSRTPEGRKIQTAILQSPVAPDTRTIQAELFCRLVPINPPPILFGRQAPTGKLRGGLR